MAIGSEWWNRLLHIGRRTDFEEGFDEEIRFHLETRVRDLEAEGLSHWAAMVQARREFGSVALSREDSRAAWQFRWLADLVSDLRYCLRAFRRTPVFAITAVLSLALGIGANSAIFTALDAVLWRPLPVKAPDQLVHFSISRTKLPDETDVPAGFIPQLRQSGIFSGLTATGGDGLSFTYDGRAERIIGETVSPDYFTVLGVQPALGHTFTPPVRAGDWAAEAVLSYSFWQRRFGGDPSVIGRTIHLNTYPFTITGVSAPGFFGVVRAVDYELRIPRLPEGRELAQVEQISGRPDRWHYLIGRLHPGSTIEQAQAAADAQFQQWLRTTPIQRFRKANLEHLRLVPGGLGYDEYVGVFHAPLYVLLILAGVVLLIACANVANMLLARAAARTREIAVRSSVGAGRLRLIRQMLAESILLAVAGGALGLSIANWGAAALFRFLPQGHINLAIDLHPDRRALLFTFAVSLLTGVLFGLVPAVRATRGDLALTLKTGSDAAGGAGAGFRKILVSAQVAFSLGLLIVAGIFVRTLGNLKPTGYVANPERILLFTMKPQPEMYSTERKRALAAELISRVSALPGVRSVALAENGPLGSRAEGEQIEAPDGTRIRAGADTITPGFFETAGIPRLAGRDFGPGETAKSPLVVIINQALARAAFGDRNPIGGMLKVPRGKSDGVYEIIGVVANTPYSDIHRSAQPCVWFSMEQLNPYMPTLHVRTSTPDAAAMTAAIRLEFDAIDKGFPVFNIRTLQDRIEDSLGRERMVASLSGVFGVLAMLLAAVGLYGVLAYSVSRRRREIGIRMALGAAAGSVLWMIVRETGLLVGAGSVAGVLMAVASGRVLSQSFAGLSAADPLLLTAAASVMFVVAAVAVCVPAIRGCRVDPLDALRH